MDVNSELKRLTKTLYKYKNLSSERYMLEKHKNEENNERDIRIVERNISNVLFKISIIINNISEIYPKNEICSRMGSSDELQSLYDNVATIFEDGVDSVIILTKALDEFIIGYLHIKYAVKLV